METGESDGVYYVSYIEMESFEGYNIKEFEISEDNNYFSSEGSILYNKNGSKKIEIYDKDHQ